MPDITRPERNPPIRAANNQLVTLPADDGLDEFTLKILKYQILLVVFCGAGAVITFSNYS